MSFKKIDVRKLAEIARISLSKEEIDLYEKDIAKILSFLESIECENTESSEQTVFVEDLREDVAALQYSREEMLLCSKHARDGYIEVPLVMEDI